MVSTNLQKKLRLVEITATSLKAKNCAVSEKGLALYQFIPFPQRKVNLSNYKWSREKLYKKINRPKQLLRTLRVIKNVKKGGKRS